ncbi:MAG: lipocalin family protein [Chitinophagales bacterium]|nr:lipocalin family protein [Chitinophagales bacterium]
MKKAFFLMCLVAISVTALAQRKSETKNPLIGTWKFTNQTKVNEFQKVFQNKNDFPIEYFTFNANQTFKHEFLDADEHIVKVLTGKWKKGSNSSITIYYKDIEFELNTAYFFIDKDLVLGQNFSHVIFSKQDMFDKNIAMK